jgi:hypothetical protein
MARVMRKVLLASRGQVRHELLPFGCLVARIGTWGDSPYAWVWVNPEETRLQHMSFVIICSGDEVADDAFYPLNSFNARGCEDGVWFGLVKYGAAIPPIEPFFKS